MITAMWIAIGLYITAISLVGLVFHTDYYEGTPLSGEGK